MKKPTITIQTDIGSRDVQAEYVDGLFAVHRTWSPDGDDPRWQLTHLSSGLAVLSRVTRQQAKKALKAIRASGLDWTLPNSQRSITSEHAKFGAELRRQYPVIERTGK